MTAREMKFLRYAVGETRADRVRNNDVRDQLSVKRVRKKIEDNRTRWLRHI